MADPFDSTGNNPDFWRNLQQFGFAAMAAGAKPGARTLGALGEGGMVAMESSRQNALARSQSQYQQAQTQNLGLQSQLIPLQVGMERQKLNILKDAFGDDGAAGLPKPDISMPFPNNTGMDTSPNVGANPALSNQTISKPSTSAPANLDEMLNNYTAQNNPSPQQMSSPPKLVNLYNPSGQNINNVPAPTKQQLALSYMGAGNLAGEMYRVQAEPALAREKAAAELPYQIEGARRKTQLESLENAASEVDKKAGEALNDNFLLDQMRQESQSWEPGKFADWEGQYRAYAQASRKAIGLPDDPELNKSLGDYQAFNKNGMQLVRQAVRETSSRAAVQEFNMIQKALPSAEMSKQGITQIFDQMQSVNDYKLAKQQAQKSWRQSHGGTTEGFDVDFNKNIGPTAFLVHRMPAEQWHNLATELQKTEEGRKMIPKIISQMQYAKENGLLDLQ